MKWLDSLFGGPKDMAALPPGTTAPDFSLSTVSLAAGDGAKFALQDALKKGPVLAVFFKVSCPTCQYALPYIERINKSLGGKQITIVGISQNNQTETAAFLKHYGITFSTLLDDPCGYPVSNAYSLTNVPSLFLIAQDGEIEVTSVGWLKHEIEDIHRRLAEAQQTSPVPIFQPGEKVHEFRAG
jgi:peroxiredoxin